MPRSPGEPPAIATNVRVEVAFLTVGAIATILFRIEQESESPAVICEATAWGTAILAVLVASDMRQRFDLMLERLFHREAIDLSQGTEANVKQRIQTAADRGAMVFAFLLPALLLVAYVSLGIKVAPLICVSEALAAFIVGGYLGRGVVYGFLGSFLRRRGASVIVKPSHPDGAAGLKPAGDFYTYQATLLMIPTAFLAFWWLAMQLWIPDSDLTTWHDWYLGFFLLAIACELAAFAFPLLFFHQEMKTQKRELLTAADEIGDRIVSVKQQLQSESATSRIRVLEEELAGLNAQFENIEDLPTWPFDRVLRRRLTFGNMTLVIPIFVGNLDKVKEGLQNILAI